jgi:cytochrome c oxidase cbb3-type subunit 4
MFKHYFEGAENIAVGPVISLIIFFAFFIVLLYWVFKVDKGFIKKMEDLPLNDDTVVDQDSQEKI